MITMGKWAAIRQLNERGYGKRTIARMLGVSRNTVKRALKQEDVPKYERKKLPAKKTDPFQDIIKEMLWEKEFIGTRILTEIRKQGYTGSLTTLYRFLKKIKKDPPVKTTCRYETEPAEQAQFDWSPYEVILGGKKRKVICFLFILGYSRRKYMTFSLNGTLASVIEALEEAIRFFGGSPKKVLLDNAKQMVIEHLSNGTIQFNETFLKLAGLYRFQPKACKLYWPRTKGKVERPFYYIDQHFIKGNEFSSIENLIQRGHSFIDLWDNRPNGTTKDIPKLRFEEEKDLLISLPEARFSPTIRELRKVSWDCLVSFRACRYSCPHSFSGKKVWVRESHGAILEIMDLSGNVIARHLLSDKKGATVIQEEHYQGIKSSTPKTAPRIREIFIETFSEADIFYQGLVKTTSYNAPYHAKKILEQRRIYEDEHIEEALQKAIEFGAFSHQAVENVLKSYPLKEDPLNITDANYVASSSTRRPLSEYNLLLTEAKEESNGNG